MRRIKPQLLLFQARKNNIHKRHPNNNVLLLSLQKHSHYRYYTITAPTTPTTVSENNNDTSSSCRSSNNIINNPISSSHNEDKQQQQQQHEMDILLERANDQARKISLLAFRNNNNNNQRYTKRHDLTSGNNETSNVHHHNDKDESMKYKKLINKHYDTHKNDNNNNNIQENVYNMESEIGILDQAHAAEELLSLTSCTNFQFAFRQKQQKQILLLQKYGKSQDDGSDNVVLSLHYAFLNVIQWLCKTLSAMSNEESTVVLKSSLEHPIWIDATETPSTTTKTIIDQNPSFSNVSMSTTLTSSSSSSSSFTNVPLPSRESILLSHILTLTDRSQALNLPLSITLYKEICTLIAKYSNSDSNISLLILDLSIVARDALTGANTSSSGQEVSISTGEEILTMNDTTQQIIQAHFFSNAMKELLQRNQIRDMIQLFHGMRNVHNIHKVDLNTGIELLSLLKDKVDEHVMNKDDIIDNNGEINFLMNEDAYPKDRRNHNTIFDETEAMELAMILQAPVMEELNAKRKELEDYKIESIESMFDNNNDDDDEGLDEYWDDELSSNANRDQEYTCSVYFDDIDEEDEGTKDSLDRFDDDDTRQKIDKSSKKEKDEGEATSSLSVLQGNDWYRNGLKDAIYNRNTSFFIPDLVPQLEDLNGNSPLFFTQEYEENILNDLDIRNSYEDPQSDDDDDIDDDDSL